MPQPESDETCDSHRWYSVVLRDGTAGFACSQYLRSVADSEIFFDVRFPNDGSRGSAVVSVKHSAQSNWTTLVVIDAGGTADSLHNYLRRNHLSGVIGLSVITNPRNDHWAGFPRILKNQGTRFLLAPAKWPSCQTRFVEFAAGLRGVRIFGPDCRWDFLAEYRRGSFTYLPSAPEVGVKLLSGGEASSSRRCSDQFDAASLVIQLRIRRHTFLFASDIRGRLTGHNARFAPIAQERKLLMAAKVRRALRSDVLLVPHHGDDVASTVAFVKGVHPKYAIICAERSSKREEVGRLYLSKVHATVLNSFDSPISENRDIRCSPNEDDVMACEPGPPESQRVR
jgi:hypothetical protein